MYRRLKREFKEVEVVCESNKYVGASIENGTVSCGNDHAISKVIPNIVDL